MQTRDLVRVSLFAALIGALGLAPRFDLPIAAGVPVTAQTLGVMLAGVILGARLGAISVALFLFVVACGAPLLSGGRGGLGVFAGPTAGYLAGWIAGAFVVGAIMQILTLRSVFASALIASAIGGILVVYLFGIPWLAWSSGLSLKAATIATATFLLGDLLKAIATAFIARSYFQTNPRAGFAFS